MIDANCEKVQELVLGALDDEPTAASDRVLMETHLAQCPGCRAYQASMRNLTGSLRDLETVPVPGDLSERIMARIQPAARTARPIARPAFRQYLPVAAAVLLLALAVPLLMNGLSGKNGQPGGQIAATQTQPAVVTTTEAVDNPPAQPTAHSPKPPVEKAPTGTAVAEKPKPVQPAPPQLKEPVEVAVVPEPVDPVQEEAVYTEVELAMASVSEDFNPQDEEDVYYDPMAELVGF